MIFIKKLRMKGFKTFANETNFVFKSGITGIVGGCGCGKTNILDALKWVLGENSKKELRVEKKTDLIFSGYKKIKPAEMAEVEIILNNDNSFLPLDYNEISIMRRIFRSGKNEYYINKQKCRLKDIHSLFANTGVGKGSNSFMEQKIIDIILFSEPENRRIIFAETEEKFIDTFNKIKKNFNKLFKELYKSGKVSLELTNKKNILKSGININVQLPGKKTKSIKWFGGGERTLFSIILMFSIFMVNPSPFCVFDVIDAALDEQTINKFLKLIKKFSHTTQFIIVTYNKRTIDACNSLYGIIRKPDRITRGVPLNPKEANINI